METKNIFIDTSSFRNKAFDLTNDSLVKLRKLGASEKISIYTTSITRRECKKNLAEMIDAHDASTKKLNVHIKNSGLSEINFDELKTKRLDNWEKYLVDSKIQEIPIHTDCIEKIFDDYFNSNPPFGGKNKKSEFPDAFVLETLENWCNEHEEKIYAVSSDNPVLSYKATNIIFVNSIEEFLDIYSKEEEKLYSFALSSFNHLKPYIIDKIKEKFEARYYFESDLFDSEISDVEVEEVKLIKAYIINVEDLFCQIDTNVDISFTASITYGDQDMIYRDSDTGYLESLENIRETINFNISATVSIEIGFSETMNIIDSYLRSVRVPNSIEFRVVLDESHEQIHVSSKEKI